MTNIKLNDLDRWQLLPKGKALQLPSPIARRVRLSVNVPERCNLYVTFETGETRFLASVGPGLDELEFSARGNLAIGRDWPERMPDDGEPEFWFLTAEHERPRFESVTEAFAEIVQRAPRNYDLEMMMWRAEQNANRRIAAQFAEMEKRMAEATKKGETTDGGGTGIHEPEVPGDKKAPGSGKAAAPVKDGAGAGQRKAPVRKEGGQPDDAGGSPEGDRKPAGALQGDQPE